MKINNLAFWNDGWFIENDIAWFLSSEKNAIFKYSFESGRCEFVAKIPSKGKDIFRQYVKCIKSDNNVICLPCSADSFLLYSIESNTWTEIKIDNHGNDKLSCWEYVKKGNVLYILSNGLKKVIALDITEKRVIGYYKLSEKTEDVLGSVISEGNMLYAVSSCYSQIYAFDCSKKKTSVYRLPDDIDDNFRSISFLNKKIWLSGRKKKLYRWDIEMEKIDIYEKFPSDFGIYNFSGECDRLLDCETDRFDVPIFIESIHLNQCIWFIPFQTNKILYYNFEADKLKEFEMEEEEENEYSLKNRILKHKYLIEYVKDNRYIGLYSLRNEHVIEIDTETLEYRFLPFVVDESCETLFENRIWDEKRKSDSLVYLSKLKSQNENESKSNKCIGKHIYQKII